MLDPGQAPLADQLVELMLHG
ncbi:MAG: hypothetical protein QOG05_1491, partial [Streptosporangiaceae bacterium]|nr:hypothetical protein [Streptosporangiaceae bacterium]